MLTQKHRSPTVHPAEGILAEILQKMRLMMMHSRDCEAPTDVTVVVRRKGQKVLDCQYSKPLVVSELDFASTAPASSEDPGGEGQGSLSKERRRNDLGQHSKIRCAESSH